MFKNSTVLVVDDEIKNIELAEVVLKKEGYSLFFAMNGKEAIELIHQHKIHVLVLDLMLPDTDGFAILKEIKSDPRYENIEVIIVSALNDEVSMQKAKTLGACSFLSKPYDIISLKSKVKESLKHSQHNSADIEAFLDKRFKEMHLFLDEKKTKESVIEFLKEPNINLELSLIMNYLNWFCEDSERVFSLNAKVLRHNEYRLVGESTLDQLQSCMNKVLIRSSIKDSGLLPEELFKSSSLYFC